MFSFKQDNKEKNEIEIGSFDLDRMKNALSEEEKEIPDNLSRAELRYFILNN
jgi:hypothetical protein